MSPSASAGAALPNRAGRAKRSPRLSRHRGCRKELEGPLHRCQASARNWPHRMAIHARQSYFSRFSPWLCRMHVTFSAIVKSFLTASRPAFDGRCDARVLRTGKGDGSCPCPVGCRRHRQATGGLYRLLEVGRAGSDVRAVIGLTVNECVIHTV